MSWISDLIGYRDALNALGQVVPRRRLLHFVDADVTDNPALGTTDISLAGLSTQHGDLQPADGIHTTLWKAFANATDRKAWTLTAADVGKRALQLDTAKMWDVVPSLVSPGTYTWGDNAGPESSVSALFTIMGADPLWWIDGVQSTIVDVGGGVASSASDASGHGFAATFTATHRPSIIASGLSGKPTLRFTSSQYGGNASFSAAAPGTTPQYYFMVVKSATLAASSIFIGTAPTGNIYVGSGPAPADYNGNTGPFSSIMAANTWYILEVLRTNQNTDYIQLSGIPGTVGTTAGNAAQTGYMLNATLAGAQGNDMEMATAFQYPVVPSGPQRTALRAWAHSVWPAIP